MTLTLGKWHHLAYSCNKHSCISFIDGHIHTIYTIPPGDSSGVDVTIKVARVREKKRKRRTRFIYIIF